MLMQLTEQNSSRQSTLMYYENVCTKMVQIIRKNVQYVLDCFYTYSYLAFQLGPKYFKN